MKQHCLVTLASLQATADDNSVRYNADVGPLVESDKNKKKKNTQGITCGRLTCMGRTETERAEITRVSKARGITFDAQAADRKASRLYATHVIGVDTQCIIEGPDSTYGHLLPGKTTAAVHTVQPVRLSSASVRPYDSLVDYDTGIAYAAGQKDVFRPWVKWTGVDGSGRIGFVVEHHADIGDPVCEAANVVEVIKLDERYRNWRHEHTQAYKETPYLFMMSISCNSSPVCRPMLWVEHIAQCNEPPFLATRNKKRGTLRWTKSHTQEKKRRME